MKKYLVYLLFLIFTINVNSQEYMDTLVNDSCSCIDGLIQKEQGASFIEKIGLCILNSATPYKEEFLKDTGFDLDDEAEDGQEIGVLVATKMRDVCPDVLVRLSEKLNEEQSSPEPENKEPQTAKEFQEELNEQYKDPLESPLKARAIDFEGHDFFEIDTTYTVTAKFARALNALPFQMKTTSSRLPVYEKYGTATFTLNGQEMQLQLYQSHSLREDEAYKDYLFLPFTDPTNGEETYGGGRFIDLSIPEGNTIVIDFNKAYNPYCAYGEGFSCPIPPVENNLRTPIRAGVKKPKE